MNRNIETRYMTVTLDLQPDGANIACWMSTVEFWASEKQNYPFDYQYLGIRCAWLIHANIELTPKIVQMVGETGDRLCASTEVVNAKRLAVNR